MECIAPAPKKPEHTNNIRTQSTNETLQHTFNTSQINNTYRVKYLWNVLYQPIKKEHTKTQHKNITDEQNKSKHNNIQQKHNTNTSTPHHQSQSLILINLLIYYFVYH